MPFVPASVAVGSLGDASLARRALRSGGAAALSSALALMWRGRHDAGSATAPLNAVSHIAYGDEAFEVDRPTLRHTLPGVLLHAASGVFWALLFEGLRGHHARRGLGATAADAVAATAVAAVVDLAIVPRRLTPGFERRLSARSLALVYGALAAGLLLGARRLDR